MSDSEIQQSNAALVESWQPYFVTEYQRDSRNQQRQSWDEYWGWVKNLLLEGGSGFGGWMQQVDQIVAAVRDAETRARLREMLYRVGRLIAAEWSKDSACRKMFSTPLQGRPNLMELGRRLQRAVSHDAGDGASIELAVAEAEAQLLAAFRSV